MDTSLSRARKHSAGPAPAKERPYPLSVCCAIILVTVVLTYGVSAWLTYQFWIAATACFR